VGSYFDHRPRLPRPPLLSRTAGFPRSGWRARLFPQGLPNQPGDSSTDIHTPLQPTVYPALDTPPQLSRNWAQCPMTARSACPPSPRASLPSPGVTRQRVLSDHHLGDRYVTVFAHTGSCAESIALLSALLYARPSGLCRLLSAPAGHRSGRAMARTGLRMMPTFPSPPLKFRTAGFPSVRLKG